MSRFHSIPPGAKLNFWKLGAILFFVFLVFEIFSGSKKIILSRTNLTAVEWPRAIEFCGEPVPLDDFYIRESWEKEFLVLLASDYQNILYLKRAPKFFPTIESELTARDLPDDLKYLAVAESALREDVRSSAGAVGIWQFVAGTARDWGLRVDDAIDERNNFEKATPAALDYLQFLHDKFDSWTLAAAAYNSGENGLARRLDEQNVAEYYDLYLNNETSQYLFRILAIKEIMTDPKKYGLEIADETKFAWPDFEVKNVIGPIPDLANFASENRTTLRAVKELNPWVVGENLPSGSFYLKIER